MPTPNDSGVFEPAQCTEVIEHATANGDRLEVYLVELPDGWRCGANLRIYDGCGDGWLPSLSTPPDESRDVALQRALDGLRHHAVGIGAFFYQPTRYALMRRQCTEWIDSFNQRELF